MSTQLSLEDLQAIAASLSSKPTRVPGFPSVRLLSLGGRIIGRMADAGEVDEDETPHLENLRSIATQMENVEV